MAAPYRIGGPAALFYNSRTRAGEYRRAHFAGRTGIMQADAYAGYNELLAPGASMPTTGPSRSWQN